MSTATMPPPANPKAACTYLSLVRSASKNNTHGDAISPGLPNWVGHQVKATIVAHDGAGVEFLEVELLIVELSPRLWVCLNKHLGSTSDRTGSEGGETGNPKRTTAA